MQIENRLFHRLRRQRGSALAITLVIIFAVATMSLGLMALVGATITMSQRRTESTEAFNMADAGLDMTMVWLSQQANPPDSNACTFSNNTFYGTAGVLTNPFGTTPGSTLTIHLDPDSNNTSSVQKKYLIESQATINGETQVVRAYVQQNSFSNYAYFADVDSGGFWDYNNHFEGPFHSNDSDANNPSRPGNQTEILWKPTAANATPDPMFTYDQADSFSVSGNVTWWENSIGNTAAPSSTSDWASIATGGQQNVTTGFEKDVNGNLLTDSSGHYIPNSPTIPLPTTNYLQQYAALGDTIPNSVTSADPNAPTTAGVNVPTNGSSVKGGIYIHGDSQVLLSTDSSNDQIITITQGTTVQTVTINPTSNSTTVSTKVGSAQATSQSYTGVTNGMLYSDGNITSLSGTIADNVVSSATPPTITSRSQMTIATDQSKNITLTGSVKYNTSRDLSKTQNLDTNFNLKAGTLGLLSNHIQVAANAPSNIEFDGSIFAKDTFDYASWGSGGPKGTMTSIGGVITSQAGIFANAYGDGTIANGYNEQYHYDTRLADYPPPFFPTTGNHYTLVSWQRTTSML